MSYRIEITAASLEELADKALALGGRLLVVHTSAASSQIRVEVAKPAPAAPAPEPVRTEVKDEPIKVADLDYKTEVAPFVLKLVEVSGKPAAQRVLDQFGVVKASHISPERWPELVAMIKTEMGQ